MYTVKEYVWSNKIAVNAEEMLILKNIHNTIHYNHKFYGENLKALVN